MYANNKSKTIESQLRELLETSPVSSIQICSSYLSLSGAKKIISICKEYSIEDITGYFGLSVPHTQNSALEFMRKVSKVSVVENYDLWFHPKVIRINHTNNTISAIIGSANLTKGGLNSNTEFCFGSKIEHKNTKEFENCWKAVVSGMEALTPKLLKEHKACEEKFAKSYPTRRTPKTLPKTEQGNRCDFIFQGELYARGEYSSNNNDWQVRVLSGSKLRPSRYTENLKSRTYGEEARQEFSAFIDKRSWTIKENTPYMSVSRAASLITGINQNGFLDWVRVEDGMQLNDLRKPAKRRISNRS